MSDDKEPIERAKEMLVYGPIGLAMYLRDTAPSFMKVFVARGRAELDQQRRTVGDQLGQARNLGETTADGTAPQLLRIVAEGLDRVRETAEGAIGTISGWAGESVSWSPDDAPEEAPSTVDDEGPADPPLAAPAASAASDARELPITDYDDLSAAQVVERLAGLSAADLGAIRDHELATRSRSTILGKIDQLDAPA